MKDKPVICVGIVAYAGLEGRVAEDYMRLMFHLGRRCPEYDFQLAIKFKSEQFRARNSIVRVALQMGADYIWMLDDDHIFDIDDTRLATDAYDLPIKLVKHLEERPEIGVVGALYYQRGGDYYPVIMQDTRDSDVPSFLTHEEVAGGMQKLAVTGGGCMMIRASVFDKISDPWFAPEHDYGTDIQLCKKIREVGLEVWCDTSLEVGHIKTDKELITSRNVNQPTEGYEPLTRYLADVQEYMGTDSLDHIKDLAVKYDMVDFEKYGDDHDAYYATRGDEQLSRQVMYHHLPHMIGAMKIYHEIIDTDKVCYGADFGCGSAPVGFELALLGHKMDFIDVDGAGAYEFTKWRAKKHGIDCGWTLKGPYDYVMMLDSLEHLGDWKSYLNRIVGSLKDSGGLIVDFFTNRDFDNPEHVTMDHDAVRAYLVSLGMTELNAFLWTKAIIEEEAA